MSEEEGTKHAEPPQRICGISSSPFTFAWVHSHHLGMPFLHSIAGAYLSLKLPRGLAHIAAHHLREPHSFMSQNLPSVILY